MYTFISSSFQLCDYKKVEATIIILFLRKTSNVALSKKKNFGKDISYIYCSYIIFKSAYLFYRDSSEKRREKIKVDGEKTREILTFTYQKTPHQVVVYVGYVRGHNKNKKSLQHTWP